MHELDRAVHRHHHPAGADADNGGQHRQPDLVCTNQRPQRLRGMQNPVADELPATPVRQGSGRHRPGVPPGIFSAPDVQRSRAFNADGTAENS